MPKRLRMSDQTDDDNALRNRPTRRVCSMKTRLRPGLHISLTELWQTFKLALDCIFESREAMCSLESLFTYVENCCKMHLASELNMSVKNYLEQVIVTKVLDSFKRVSQNQDVYFKGICAEWSLFWTRMYKVRTIFLLVDKEMAMNSCEHVPCTIWDHGMNVFRDEVMHQAEVGAQAIQCLLRDVHHERLGVIIDRGQLREISKIFSALNLYHSDLQPRLLSVSQEFYANESERLVNTLDVREFLRHFMRRREEERDRVSHYLESSTEPLLCKLLVKEFIICRESFLLDHGCGMMFTSNQFDGLSLLYSVLEMTPDGLAKLKKMFYEILKESTNQIVKNPKSDPEKDSRLISSLLEIRQKAEHVRTFCFCSNDDLGRSIREAFESSVNQRSQAVAEYLAKHVDHLLRSGNRGGSDVELEAELDKTMTIFRYIDGKDVFKAFFRKDLAKRLLLCKSASEDAEKAMLSKLKHECGPAYTSEMEAMFQDMDTSQTFSRDFRIHLQNQLDLKMRGVMDTENDTSVASTSDGSTTVPTLASITAEHLKHYLTLELTVSIIRPSAWPSYKSVKINYTDEMFFLKVQFERYYRSKHSGRKLNFAPTLGTCSMRAKFDKDRTGVFRELLLTELQALILLQFNETLHATTESATKVVHLMNHFYKAIGGDKVELDKAILSLSMAKGQRLLVKKPSSATVNEDDSFYLNKEYQNKLMRIKLSNILAKETKEEVKSVEDSVWQNRKILLDCALVRVMKTRRELEHVELIATVQKQLNFPCSVVDIKKRIDDLIDRNYLSRDSKSKSRYIYVA